MQCQLRDINVYYEVYGEGHPLIAIYGFMPDHHLMTGCMEPVFKQREGWQRFYPDLPGMGQTPGPEWMTNSDQMLDVALEFIEQVIPGQYFALAGESYGRTRYSLLLRFAPVYTRNSIKPLVIAVQIANFLLLHLSHNQNDLLSLLRAGPRNLQVGSRVSLNRRLVQDS